MFTFLLNWFGVCLLPLLVFNSSTQTKFVASPHPFYISVTEINHNVGTKSLEISCKFFTEDFEQTLEKAYNTKLDITLSKDKPAFDNYIPDYIGKHFALSVDGQTLPLTYVGFEKDKESAFAFFEVANVTGVKALGITNDFLHEFSTQQINILHVSMDGKRKSIKLNYPDTKATFAF